MLKKLLIPLVLVSTTVFAQPTADQAISIVNGALTKALNAVPKGRQQALSDSQNRFVTWAQADCMARLGLTEPTQATTNAPTYAACWADQLLRRANQLEQIAANGK